MRKRTATIPNGRGKGFSINSSALIRIWPPSSSVSSIAMRGFRKPSRFTRELRIKAASSTNEGAKNCGLRPDNSRVTSMRFNSRSPRMPNPEIFNLAGFGERFTVALLVAVLLAASDPTKVAGSHTQMNRQITEELFFLTLFLLPLLLFLLQERPALGPTNERKSRQGLPSQNKRTRLSITWKKFAISGPRSRH